jgi:exodeoxyribonuclease X
MSDLRFLIADTETSGLSDDAMPCEIAWIEIDDELQVLDRVHSLIDPQRPISPGAMGIHGITNLMVAEAPTLGEFYEFIQPSIKYAKLGLIAHNLQFDARFITPHAGEVPFSLCTLRLSRHLWPECENHKLQTLRYFLADQGLEGGDAHSAMGDVETCLSVLRFARDKFGLSLYEMAELSQRPIKVEVMPFGKHRGERLAEVPSSYLSWLLKQPDVDPDLRASIENL